jgi:hypothetical protein
MIIIKRNAGFFRKNLVAVEIYVDDLIRERRFRYKVITLANKSAMTILGHAGSNGRLVFVIRQRVMQKLFRGNAEAENQQQYPRQKMPYGMLARQEYLLLCCKYRD